MFVLKFIQELINFQMLKTANGIEHAYMHLLSNFERFLQLSTFLSRLETDEREQIVSAIRRLMTSTEKVNLIRFSNKKSNF
jgi:hypothetical protein